jgi:putative MATE family efflux protein
LSRLDLTRGPLLGALVRLAAPVVVMQLCHTLYHWVDVMWVGRLGAAATAAVTTSFFAVWTAWALADLTGVSVAATVSRHMGAGRPEEAAYGAAQAALLAVLIGALVSVFGGLAAGPLFRALGVPAEVVQPATAYLRIVLGGAVISFLYVLGESILRAAGDTRTPLLVVATSLLLNAALDPLFIFGLGPLPALGVAGAALATVLAQGFAVAWFAVLAWRRHPAFPFDFAALGRFSPRYAAALVRIGLPFCLIGILYSVVYLWLARTAAPFGTAALAVVGVANRVESLSYLVAVGFALACEAMVGQNLGAGRPDRAERATWLSAGLLAGFGLAVSALMAFAPELLLGFFTADPEVVARGVPYLRILAPCQAFACLEIVLNGAFSGAGDTLPPSIISVTVSMLRIPLAGALAHGLGLGLDGIAWTITLTCVVRALIVLSWFRRGRWKTKALATSRAGHAPSPLPATVAPAATAAGASGTHPLPPPDATH